jgi:hypothetical protein
MTKILDNSEIEEIMDILENLEDEDLAVSLLAEFNKKTRELGLLILNIDEKLKHEDWKHECDKAKKSLDDCLARIRALDR